MISLLPPNVKKEIFYGHRNTFLGSLSILLCLVITGVFLIGAFGLFYMDQSIENLNKQAARSEESLKSQNIDETEKKVNDISNNLKLTSQVLSREILFSKLIQQIGAAMPPSAILTELKIIKTEGGIDLTAVASSYETATQVQVNLSDPANKIFDKADILSTACSGTATDPRYPCTISLRARFSKDNSFTLTGGKK